MIIVVILYLNQSFLQRFDTAAFVVRELLPGVIFLRLHERRKDRVRFASRFNDLALPEIFFRVVVRLEQHAFDLLVGQAVAGLNLDLGFFPTALFAR